MKVAYWTFSFSFAERFNESIFDSLPTYLLNICEVCGSSQCPYCPIYNIASALTQPVMWILVLPIVISLHYSINVFTIQ